MITNESFSLLRNFLGENPSSSLSPSFFFLSLVMSGICSTSPSITKRRRFLYNPFVFYMTPFDFKISILFFYFIPMESRYDSVDLSLSLASVTYDSTKFVVFGTRNHHERHATMRYHWYTDGQSKRTSFPIPLLSYKIRGASFSRLHMTVYTRTASSKNKTTR